MFLFVEYMVEQEECDRRFGFLHTNAKASRMPQRGFTLDLRLPTKENC